MAALEHLIPPPLVVMIVGVAMKLVARLTDTVIQRSDWQWWAAGTLIITGLAVVTMGFVEFRRAQTTIDPVDIRAASSLVTSGVFRVTRNPMYLGFTLLLIGWAVYLSSPWTAVGPIVFVLFIQRFQIQPEEHVMRQKFGDAYVNYAAAVRRWL
jgi:protein-S-isoprenylcysteine O-methyltransferase Ste14